ARRRARCSVTRPGRLVGARFVHRALVLSRGDDVRSLRTEPSSYERLALGWALLASTLGLSRPVGAEPAVPPVAAPQSTPQAPAPSAPLVSFAALLSYAEQHVPALRLASAQRG